MLCWKERRRREGEQRRGGERGSLPGSLLASDRVCSVSLACAHIRLLLHVPAPNPPSNHPPYILCPFCAITPSPTSLRCSPTTDFPVFDSVISSVTLNKGMLSLTAILAMIVVYFFAIIALQSFQDKFKDDDGVRRPSRRATGMGMRGMGGWIWEKRGRADEGRGGGSVRSIKLLYEVVRQRWTLWRAVCLPVDREKWARKARRRASSARQAKAMNPLAQESQSDAAGIAAALRGGKSIQGSRREASHLCDPSPLVPPLRSPTPFLLSLPFA